MTEAKSKRKFGCGTMALIGAVALVGLYILGSGEAEKEEQALATGPAVEVTPDELRAAYDANEAAAQQQYADKVVLIRGTVHEVSINLTNDPVVALATSDPYTQVRIFLTDETASAAATYQKGQKVAFRCTDVNETMGLPVLLKCIPA